MATESRISGGGAVRAQTEAALAAGGRGLARLSLLVLAAVPIVVVPVFGSFFAGATAAWMLDGYYPAVFVALIAAVGAGLALAALAGHLPAVHGAAVGSARGLGRGRGVSRGAFAALRSTRVAGAGGLCRRARARCRRAVLRGGVQRRPRRPR